MEYLVKKEIKDDKGFTWDPESHITERQITDERAKELIADGSIESLSGEFPEVKVS